MARSTKTRSTEKSSAPKLDPYYERITPDTFDYSHKDDDRVHFEVESFDDREELGIVHVQFRSVGRRNRVAPFHGTVEELRELAEDLVQLVDDLDG